MDFHRQKRKALALRLELFCVGGLLDLDFQLLDLADQYYGVLLMVLRRSLGFLLDRGTLNSRSSLHVIDNLSIKKVVGVVELVNTRHALQL